MEADITVTKVDSSFKRFYSEPELQAMKFKHLGKDVKISRLCYIDNPSKVSIGDHSMISEFAIVTGEVEIGNWTHIAHYTHLSGTHGIKIGDFVGVSARVSMYTSNDNFIDKVLAFPCPLVFRDPEEGPIELKNFTLIGIGTHIYPNVTIPQGCTIGEKMSVRSKDILEHWTAYGKNWTWVKDNRVQASKIMQQARAIDMKYNKIFITAEIGSSWRGDFDVLGRMMDDAKTAGCDAVKLQAFKKEHTTHPEKVINAVDEKNIRDIDTLARTIGIEWYCTPIYPEAVEFLNPYVKRWKVRYKDNKDTQILGAIRRTDKPVCISDDSPWVDYDCKYLYCVPEYPTPKEKVNMELLKQADGYSCHTPDVNFVVDVIKTCPNIKFLEFHIKPDNGKDLIDGPTSFDPFQMQELVQRIREIDNARYI